MLLALHNVSVIAVTIAGKSVRDGYFLSRFDKSALPLMMCAQRGMTIDRKLLSESTV